MVASGTDKTRRKRPYSSALRKQQERMTRELIMKALADILTIDGVYDFSMQQVADRAGLSYQSVYRHFSSREALLTSLFAWYIETAALFKALSDGTGSLDDDIPSIVPRMFAWCDEHAAMVRAATVVSLKMNIRSNTRRALDDRFRKLVAGLASNLDPKEERRAFAAIRYLVSPEAWFILTQRFEMNKEEAAEVASWATRTLVAELKKKNREAAKALAYRRNQERD